MIRGPGLALLAILGCLSLDPGGTLARQGDLPSPSRPPDVFTPARLVPPGRAGLLALSLGEVADGSEVARAVKRDGFYAAEPVLAGDCASCHADIAAQWQASAHRFASFNNPYYAAAVLAFRQERSPGGAGFCAGCHDPLLLLDGSITGALAPATPAAQAGLTCLVCHSIDSVHDRRGNGNYTLVAAPVPPPGNGPSSDHAARLRPKLLGQSELCATCHKVGLLEEVTHDRWLRGQDDYDAWEQSLAGGNGAAAVYREGSKARRCQDCHMPLVPSASGKRVRSHRFLGANAALPHLRGDPEQEALTAAFLKDAVSLDVVLMQPGPQGAVPSLEQQVEMSSLAPIDIDVVLRNRRVGHRFPGGTGDSNLAYVEVEARLVGSAKLLRDTSHVLRAQPVDGQGRPLLHRDVQHLRGVVYDTSLSPSDPQVVRYRLDPADLGLHGGPGKVEVRAWLRYRKFTPEYSAFACATLPSSAAAALRARCLTPPTLDLASAQRTLLFSPRPRSAATAPTTAASLPPSWERYLDHGLGLADGLVDRACEALPSLRRAAELAPDRAEPLLGLARMYLALGRTWDVRVACERVDTLRKDHPAALLLRAQALYRTYQWPAARPYLERAARLLPRDRNVLALLSRVRGLTGDPGGALDAADRLILIDPESEEGHYQRLLSLRELSREAEAATAEQAFLRYRRPVERDQELRARFRILYPLLADEDTPAHVHPLRAFLSSQGPG